MEAMAHGQFHDVPTMLRGGLRMHDPQDGPRYENPTFRPEKGQSPSFHMSRMVGILSDYCFSIWTCSEFHGTWIFALKKDIKKKLQKCYRNFQMLSHPCALGLLLRLLENIAHSRGTHAHEEFDELRGAGPEKNSQEVSWRFLPSLRIKKKVNEDHRKMWKTMENHNLILEKHSNILVNHLKPWFSWWPELETEWMAHQTRQPTWMAAMGPKKMGDPKGIFII